MIPLKLSTDQQRFLACFVLTISLWLLSDLPLFISGLLGVSLSIFLGVSNAHNAFAPFADPIIFLFLGGYLFSKALEETKMDEFLADFLINHHYWGQSPRKMILGIYLLTFFFSMWISNTASVAMFLPLALKVIKKMNLQSSESSGVLIVGLAYSATLGGNVTPIGSAPNMVGLGLLKNLTNTDVSFLEWMAFGGPFAFALFYMMFRMVASYLPQKNNSFLDKKPDFQTFRTLSNSQKTLLFLFALTVTCWLTPSLLQLFLTKDSSLSLFLKTRLSNANVAIFFSSLLFLFPIKSKILKAQHISQIDWSSLLLFGAGISLGKMLYWAC